LKLVSGYTQWTPNGKRAMQHRLLAGDLEITRNLWFQRCRYPNHPLDLHIHQLAKWQDIEITAASRLGCAAVVLPVRKSESDNRCVFGEFSSISVRVELFLLLMIARIECPVAAIKWDD
jgi:hypothetical protein